MPILLFDYKNNSIHNIEEKKAKRSIINLKH